MKHKSKQIVELSKMRTSLTEAADQSAKESIEKFSEPKVNAKRSTPGSQPTISATTPDIGA